MVAAFDNEAEFHACLAETDDELRRRRAVGDSVDPRENVSGVAYEPGYHRKQRNGRIVTEAFRRGVIPPNLDELELPSNIGIVSAGKPKLKPSPPSRWRRLLHRLSRLVGR